jgi:hypothetical protein
MYFLSLNSALKYIVYSKFLKRLKFLAGVIEPPLIIFRYITPE